MTTTTKDLEGKVFLLTGATEGIGKAAAHDFARRGATLVLVGRNREKTERVRAELVKESGNDRIEILLGDLSRVSEMKRIAHEFEAKHDRLDVLVNNAGAIFTDRKLSADGYEMTFALNHLAYFVITNELLDLLKKTAREHGSARIVSTSSGAHASGRLDLDDVVKREKRFSGFEVYGSSKLANILFTSELAKRLKGTGVTANCFHPGFVQTGFGANNEGFIATAIKIGASLFARTPVKGAETLVWLAASPEAAKHDGEYFMDMKPGRKTRKARDESLAKRLWDLTEGLLVDKAA